MGLQRARGAPDLLPPRVEGDPQRGAHVRDRPAADHDRAVGRRVARPQRGQRRRAGERDGPRDHPRGAAQPRVHPPRHVGLRGLRGGRRAVHARAGRGAQRRAGRRDQGRRAHVRARGSRPDLLDAGDHRAPQRGRQRPRADQPGAADRARRPLRLGPEPAARPEQRAGRRRHGRDPEPAAGLPGPRDRPRGGREVRAGVGRQAHAEVRLAHDRDVRGDRPRRADDDVRARREPDPVRRRRPSRQAPVRGASTTSSYRTSSAPRPRSWPTSCCRPRPAGARQRAR